MTEPNDRASARWIALLVLLFAQAIHLAAQEEDGTPTELWLSYDYQRKVSEPVRIFGSLDYKELTSTERFFGEWTRLGLEGGASYETSKWFRFAGGLGAYSTFRPEMEDILELRLWQEAELFWPERVGWIRRFVLGHRFRFEERFLNADERDFEWRFRYRLGTRIPLTKHDIVPKSLYMPLSAEIFADLTNDSNEIFADRSRASIGLGYVLGPTWTLELQYRRQRSRVTIDDEFRTSTDVIDFSVRTNVKIRDLLKGR